MARKPMNVFSLSFLDAMTCGFGAVILFFMIINANIDLRREDTLDDLASEVERMELKVLTGRRNLVELREELVRLIEQWSILSDRREQIETELRDIQAESDEINADSSTRDEIIERLRAELEELEAETERLAEAQTPQIAGDRLRGFTGGRQSSILDWLANGRRACGHPRRCLYQHVGSHGCQHLSAPQHERGTATPVVQVAPGGGYRGLVDHADSTRNADPDLRL